MNVFNLVSGVNETRFIVRHESCECKYGLNETVCNSKQKWNCDECQCKFKELDDWSCRILVYAIVNVIRHVKLMNI